MGRRSIASWVLMAATVSGCASGAPSGRPRPPASDDFARLHVYEIPVEAGSAASDAPFIEVSGSASVQVSPDRAHVTFAVETRAEAAGEAAGTNARAMTTVLTALRSGSFGTPVLETFGYSLRPEYRTRDDGSRVIDGYHASNHVRATLSDLDAVGSVVDRAIGAGANRISGILFEASDTEEARRQALAAAVHSARTEAEVIARELGHRLGAPIEVRGGAHRPIPGPVAFDMALTRAEMVSTPIEAAEQTVTAEVTVRFALGAELEPR